MANLRDLSLRNALEPFNMDTIRAKYEVVDKGFSFKSPDFGVLEELKNALLLNSTTIDMEPRYYMRPEYVSWDYFSGTIIFSQLIMWINDAHSRMDFVMDKIIIPDATVTESLLEQVLDRAGTNYTIESWELDRR